jgi:hypothetical protein
VAWRSLPAVAALDVAPQSERAREAEERGREQEQRRKERADRRDGNPMRSRARDQLDSGKRKAIDGFNQVVA